MKKSLLSLIFLPIIITNTGSSEVQTVVKNEVSGENASAHSEVSTTVNGKETYVESDQPGEIKVEVKDGEVNVESSPEAQPTIIISDESEEEIGVLGEEKEVEVENQVEEIKTKIVSFFEDFLFRLKDTFFFWEK